MALTPEQNRDEIIAMALVAGMSANIGYTEASGEHFPAVAALKTSVPVQWLERFAQLVAAKAAADEREACAHLCDEICAVRGVPFYGLPGMKGSAQECAAAIRARSKP